VACVSDTSSLGSNMGLIDEAMATPVGDEEKQSLVAVSAEDKTQAAGKPQRNWWKLAIGLAAVCLLFVAAGLLLSHERSKQSVASLSPPPSQLRPATPPSLPSPPRSAATPGLPPPPHSVPALSLPPPPHSAPAPSLLPPPHLTPTSRWPPPEAPQQVVSHSPPPESQLPRSADEPSPTASSISSPSSVPTAYITGTYVLWGYNASNDVAVSLSSWCAHIACHTVGRF
jgi:hypothetical protein